jgi:glycerate kinase
MPRLLAAPDKFRGTAGAVAIAAAAGRAARRCGWSAEELPLADGGEGTLDVLSSALGGRIRHAAVSGPLGGPVDAPWLELEHTAGIPLPEPLVPGRDPTAVVEAAAAAGRSLLVDPRGDEPVLASTVGVGALLIAAIARGARQVVVAVGGTATTDGGEGACSAVAAAGGLGGAPVVVACDVTTGFLDAAALFGPQKGASPSQVVRLTARLEALAHDYRSRTGVDVVAMEGAGAGGGLAGGLASLGAVLVRGFPLVAGLCGLERRLVGADLVVTGEGRLDLTSFEGKVVGGVLDALEALGASIPLLCVVGDATPRAVRHLTRRAQHVELVRLVPEFGAGAAREETARCVETVVGRRCCSPGTA